MKEKNQLFQKINLPANAVDPLTIEELQYSTLMQNRKTWKLTD